MSPRVSRDEPFTPSIPLSSTEHWSKFSSCFSFNILSVITTFPNKRSHTAQQGTRVSGTVWRLGPCTRLHRTLHTWYPVCLGTASYSLLPLPLILTATVKTCKAGAIVPFSQMKTSKVPEFKPPVWEKRVSPQVFVTHLEPSTLHLIPVPDCLVWLSNSGHSVCFQYFSLRTDHFQR